MQKAGFIYDKPHIDGHNNVVGFGVVEAFFRLPVATEFPSEEPHQNAPPVQNAVNLSKIFFFLH